jgi:WD40 repeat protein
MIFGGDWSATRQQQNVVWDLEKSSVVLVAKYFGSRFCFFNEDSRVVAFDSRQQMMTVWNPENGEEITSFPVSISCVLLLIGSKNGMFCCASSFLDIKAWEISTGRAVFSKQFRGAFIPTSVCFGVNDASIIAGINDSLTAWNISEGALMFESKMDSDRVAYVAYSSEIQRVYASTMNGFTIEFEAGTGREIARSAQSDHLIKSSLVISNVGCILL